MAGRVIFISQGKSSSKFYYGLWLEPLPLTHSDDQQDIRKYQIVDKYHIFTRNYRSAENEGCVFYIPQY